MHSFEAEVVGVRHAGPFRVFSQTFMSLPFCAALAWATGGASFKDMHDFDNPDVQALVPRVAVVADPERRRFEPLVEVTLEGGATLVWEEREGRAAYLLTWQRAVAMTNALLEEVGRSTTSAICAMRSATSVMASRPRSGRPEPRS